MLPNRFPDRGETPEFNSVDASLWFVVAVHEFLAAAGRAGLPLALDDRARLEAAIDAILAGYAKGTRFGIRADADGLLAAGEPGVQLTWMDAKVGDWVVTPRIGKPVEVQALWINALRLAGARTEQLARARAARDGIALPCASGTTGAAISPTSSTSITSPVGSTPASGPTRSSRSAACPSRCSRATARAASSMPSKRVC